MTQEELYKIESDYSNELHNRREAAKNFTGQVAGRHSDMFSGHEMTWMTRGFMEGYMKAKEALYTEEQAREIWRAGQEYWKTSGASITFEELTEKLKQK